MGFKGLGKIWKSFKIFQFFTGVRWGLLFVLTPYFEP